jgi:GxxExxY protein
MRTPHYFFGASEMERRQTFSGKHTDITDKVLKAFFKAYNTLGYGFAERVYENALSIELNKLGLKVERQKDITVYYEGDVVGEYVADVVVNGVVMLELKAVRTLTDDHEAQLLNYLKATPVEVDLLLNFGVKPEHRRKIFDNELKGSRLASAIVKKIRVNPLNPSDPCPI